MSSAALSMTSVRSPPLPRVPVSRARSSVSGVSASSRSSPATARLDAPSQSASSAVLVLVIRDLCCQKVSADHARSEQTGELELLSRGVGEQRLLDGLSPAQRTAVTDGDARRLVVPGAAGTGQERVIETHF